VTDALFAEVLDSARADAVADASSTELLAWVSSALGLWREPGVADDPAADDLAFVRWLGDRRDAIADRLLAALGAIGSPTVAESASGIVEPLTDPEPGSAWLMRDGTAQVVVLSFAHDDGGEVLLCDVDGDGRLADIQLATNAAELVATADDEGETEAVSTRAAAALVAEAVERRAADPGLPTDAELANMALLLARLALLGFATTEPRWHARVPSPILDPEADVAAIRTLRSALGDLVDAPPPSGAEPMVAPAAALVRWTDDAGRPVQELEGLAALEWADWLGAVIGTVRAGVGTTVSGDTLVDQVNRTPEITSSIPKRDRAWYAWGFAVAIETWADLGIVDHGRRLTEAGHWVLPQALLTAWAPHD